MPALRRRLGALVTLAAALLLLSGTVAAPAVANDDYVDRVGYLDASYWPGEGNRFYSGLAYPAYPGQCVAVQRKSIDVGWTNTWVELDAGDTSRCREYGWSITNDLAVNTKTACLAMRPYLD